jgi:hypothetical protein
MIRPAWPFSGNAGLQYVFGSTYTEELHSPGLTVTASDPDMLKIQMIGFFFENRLRWQFESAVTTGSMFRLPYLSTTTDLTFWKP